MSTSLPEGCKLTEQEVMGTLLYKPCMTLHAQHVSMLKRTVVLETLYVPSTLSEKFESECTLATGQRDGHVRQERSVD